MTRHRRRRFFNLTRENHHLRHENRELRMILESLVPGWLGFKRVRRIRNTLEQWSGYSI